MKNVEIIEKILDKIAYDEDNMDYDTYQKYRAVDPNDDDEVIDFFCEIFEEYDVSDKQVFEVVQQIRNDLDFVHEAALDNY